jgi:hypothetical protein
VSDPGMEPRYVVAKFSVRRTVDLALMELLKV